MKNYLKKVYLRLQKSEFINHFKILASGTIFSQIIVISSSPIIARIYTPESFGLFANFVAIMSIIYPISSFGFDRAIVIEKNSIGAKQIIILSFLINLLLFFVLSSFIVIFNNQIVSLLNIKEINFWLFLLPLAIAMRGLILISNAVLNRFKNYKILSKTFYLRSIINASIIILLGYYSQSIYGLFLGELLSSLLVLFFLIFHFRRNFFFVDQNFFKKKQYLKYIKKYNNFPSHYIPAKFLDTLRHMVPIFFLTKFFPIEYAGYFILVFQVINYPLMFVSNSVTVIQFKKVSELLNNNLDIKPYLIKLMLLLSCIIFFPAITFFLYAPEIFSFIFGKNWIFAGLFAQTLIPSLALKFIIAPLGSMMINTGNLKLYNLWQIFSFLSVFCTLFYFSEILDVLSLIKVFNLVNFFIHLILVMLVTYSAFNIKKIN